MKVKIFNFLALIVSATLFSLNLASAQCYYQNCLNNYYNYNYLNYYSNLTPTTYSATNIYTNTAKVNGYVAFSGNNYNQNIGYTWFEYSTNPYYLNNTTGKMRVYSSTTMNANLQNLSCGQTYYYRAVSSGSNETRYGSTLSFTTSPCYNYNNYYDYNYNYNYDYGYNNCQNNYNYCAY